MRNITLLLLMGFLFAFCQTKKQENKPELRYAKNDQDWYNRKIGVTKYLIKISEGNPKVAIKQANKQGVDAEACFVKALAFAKMGNADSAMANVIKSMKWGLTIDRY